MLLVWLAMYFVLKVQFQMSEMMLVIIGRILAGTRDQVYSFSTVYFLEDWEKQIPSLRSPGKKWCGYFFTTQWY